MPKTFTKKLKLPSSYFEKHKEKKFGWPMTIFLACVLVLIIAVLWALFISGPARLHEVEQKEAFQKVEETVPGIQGVSAHVFEYITYTGYTEDDLYWIDQKFKIITSRPIETLDYQKAKDKAKESYGIDTETIELTFGYNTPCYEIIGSDKMILLDYDTLTRVYERSTKVNGY